MEQITKQFVTFVLRFLKLDSNQKQLPRVFIQVAYVQFSLLNLAYLIPETEQPWNFAHIRIVQYLARPQVLLQMHGIEYLTCLVCICYITAIFIRFTGWQYIAIFGSLLDLCPLNFLIEQNMTIIQQICSVILIVITLMRNLVSRGKYDIDLINGDYIETNFPHILMKVVNICQIFSGQFDYTITFILSISNCVLHGYVILRYQILQSNTLTQICFCIQLISIYYGIAIYSHLEYYFNTDALMIPLIYSIGAHIVYVTSQWNLKSTDLRIQAQNLLPRDISPLYQYLIYQNIQTIKSRDSKKLSSPEDIIYASMLILDEPLKAVKALQRIKMKTFGIIKTAKIDRLSLKALKKIKLNLDCNSRSNFLEENSQVRDLMESEQYSQKLLDDILLLVKQKISLLQNYHTKLRTKAFKKQSMQTINFIMKIKEEITKQYRLYPNDRTQSVLGFFLVEMMNDFLSANELFSVVAVSGAKVKQKMIGNNSPIGYMIAEYNQDMYIKKASAEAAKMIKHPSDKLIGKLINQYVPQGINIHHNLLIDEFMNTGYSKFYRTSNSNMIQLQDRSCINFELSFDVNFLEGKAIFIILMRSSFHQPYQIVVDQSNCISAYTSSLKQYLFSKHPDRFLIGENIAILIPSLNGSSFQDSYKDEVLIQLGQTQFTTTLQIHERLIDQKCAYRILTLLYIRKFSNIDKQSSDLIMSPIRKSNSMDSLLIDENTLIDVPRVTMVLKETDHPLGTYNESPYHVQIESPHASQIYPLVQRDVFFDSGHAPYQESEESNPGHKDIELQVADDQLIDDAASVMSSMQAMRSSIYYKKYQILQKINELSGQSKNHNLHFIFLTIAILIQFILCILVIYSYIQQLSSLETNVSALVQDIDLIQIKNLATQPIEAFLITRWTIFNYKNLNTANIINTTQLTQLLAFPMSNLPQGYDLLDSNLKTVMQRQNLQSYMEQQNNYSIYRKSQGRNPGTVQMSLRNFLDTLLQYQYTVKMEYQITGTVVTDSQPIVFQYKNYRQTKEIFESINDHIFEETINRTKNVQNLCQYILISIYTSLIIFIVGGIYYQTIIIKNCDKYYALYAQSDIADINTEITRLKILSDIINKDDGYIFRYIFNLDQLEKTIIPIQQIEEKKKKTIINHQITKFSYMPIILLILIVITDSITTYIQSNDFLDRYPGTAKLYRQMSDVGTDVPTMFAQREVLYGRVNFPFLNSTNHNSVWIELMSALRRTQEFTSGDYKTSLLISESFMALLQSFNSDDLCPYVPVNNYNDTLALCQQVLAGNIQKGLKPLLIYLTNFIQNDQQLNNFTAKTYYNFLELEGIYMVSSFIRIINTDFKNDLLDQTNNLIATIKVSLYLNKIYNIFYLITLNLFILYGFFYAKSMIRYYFNSQRLIYLVPRNSLLLDDYFERNVKMQIIYDLLN